MNTPSERAVPGAPEELVSAAMAHVTRDRLVELVTGLVGVPSPTGAERPLAEWASAAMRAAGLEAHTQVIDEHQANAVGVLHGPGQGPTVLLYAPTDTYTTGDPALDVPWAMPELREDMVPRARVAGDLVVGLAAGNPKGHAAVVMMAAEALAGSGVPVPGDVVVGLGAGGMPSFAVPGTGTPGRANTGHGIGAHFLLERGFHPDLAVIAKPGWNVSHEEVGLVWIDVDAPGEHSYVGSRHRLPYLNAAAVAAEAITELEAWFPEYAEAHETGTMRPQGVVSSVHGGFERLAASTSALVRLRLDVRMTPDQTPGQVLREVRARLAPLSQRLGVELRARQVAAVPGTRTDPTHPVVRSAVRAWEAVAGEPHVPIRGNSGATDANMLRLRGVPTARVGMPKVLRGPDGGEVDFSMGMNLADLVEMRRLVEVVVRTVLDGALAAAPEEDHR